MSAYQVAGLWSALLILVLVGLGVRVMLARWRHRVSLGDGADGQMMVLSRSFGNAAEYIPAGIGSLILLAALGAVPLHLHVIGAALFVGRLLHPVGLAMTAPNWPRAAGMLLTWAALIASAILLLVASLAL